MTTATSTSPAAPAADARAVRPFAVAVRPFAVAMPSEQIDGPHARFDSARRAELEPGEERTERSLPARV